MEFSFIQTQTFLHFLFTNGILSEKQQASLFDDFSHSSSRKFIFILADFFKKLTPSDSYDLAIRLFTVWEKQKNNAQNMVQTQNNTNSQNYTINNNPPITKILDSGVNFGQQQEITPKKQENYKLTIRNYKFSNIIRGFIERTTKKTLESCLSKLKSHFSQEEQIKKHGNSDYFLQIADFKNEMNLYQNPTFRFINNEKKPIYEDSEGPRPFLVTPYKTKETQDNSENSNRTLRNSCSQKKIANGIHEKLYREASLKKINQVYLENVKKRQEVEGCTFRPNIIQNPKDNLGKVGSIYRISSANGNKTNSSDNQLNKNNVNENENGRNNAELTDRYEKLYLDGEVKKHILQEKQKIYQEIQSKECTFQPKTIKAPPKNIFSKKKQMNGQENKENNFRKIRSVSNYEKSTGPLEINDMNIEKLENLKEVASTKANGNKTYEKNLNGFLTEKNSSTANQSKGFRKGIVEKMPFGSNSNRKVKSVYHENDFLKKKETKI